MISVVNGLEYFTACVWGIFGPVLIDMNRQIFDHWIVESQAEKRYKLINVYTLSALCIANHKGYNNMSIISWEFHMSRISFTKSLKGHLFW